MVLIIELSLRNDEQF